MLPLESTFLVPSLVITPVAVAVLLTLRRRAMYATLWRGGIATCFLLTAFYAVLVLNTPLYSQRDHVPSNPGGFSVGMWAILAVLFLWTCVVIPAFPLLVALACLPPRDRSRTPLVVICCIYVVVLGSLMWRKNVSFVDDFEQTKIKERTEHIQAREKMRQ